MSGVLPPCPAGAHYLDKESGNCSLQPVSRALRRRLLLQRLGIEPFLETLDPLIVSRQAVHLTIHEKELLVFLFLRETSLAIFHTPLIGQFFHILFVYDRSAVRLRGSSVLARSK